MIFEAYQYGDNPLVEPFMCGKATFLIFPCATPLASLPSSSTDKEVCYEYSTQLPINQLLNEEQVYTNIGQVHISVLLEIQEKHGKLPTGSYLLARCEKNLGILNMLVLLGLKSGGLSNMEYQYWGGGLWLSRHSNSSELSGSLPKIPVISLSPDFK